jgi:threonine dehydrogenase-like Zn-dependent dehydrogenase
MLLRALRYDGTSLKLETNAPDPVPGPGEALVRPLRVGVCSTDVEIASGRSGALFRGTLGHEMVGVVEYVNLPDDPPAALVERARRLKDKRVVASINLVCGKCDMCRAGLSSHCRGRNVLGCSGRDGCFADFVTVPVSNLHVVPDKVDDERAVFAEPLAAAAHAAQMFKVEGKPYITVLGDGKLGLLCVQVMGRLNAKVRLLGKHPKKFGLCERWGIKHRHVDEVGRRQDQDVVVDCTGSASGLALAMQLVRPRGKIVLKSSISPFPMRPGAPVPGANHPAWATPVNLAPLVINEVELIGSRCGPVEVALAMLEREEVRVAELVTRRMKLSDGVEAMKAAAVGGAAGEIKVVMEV